MLSVGKNLFTCTWRFRPSWGRGGLCLSIVLLLIIIILLVTLAARPLVFLSVLVLRTGPWPCDTATGSIWSAMEPFSFSHRCPVERPPSLQEALYDSKVCCRKERGWGRLYRVTPLSHRAIIEGQTQVDNTNHDGYCYYYDFYVAFNFPSWFYFHVALHIKRADPFLVL